MIGLYFYLKKDDANILVIIKPNKIDIKPNIYNITIISIVDTEDLSNYELALQTTKCYSLKFGYTFLTVNINHHRKILSKCNQTDFMFRRHCFLSYYMEEKLPYSKYVLFVDADIGVINPIHNLTKYLPLENEEVLFEERIFNYEISAGSYFIKNSLYARRLLLKWAEYEKYIPQSFTGSDNVALHPYLLKYIPNEYKNGTNICRNLWNKSKSFYDIDRYVACVRYFMNNYFNKTKNFNNDEYYLDNGRIKIIKKLSKRKWVRDVWLTDSQFSENDFMFHGLKRSAINSNEFGSWKQVIFLDNFNISTCKNEDFYQNWLYRVNCMTNSEIVENKLKNLTDSINKNFDKIVNELKINMYYNT